MRYIAGQRHQCPYCHQPASAVQIAKFALPERKVFLDRSAMLNRCVSCDQLFMSVYEQVPKKEDQDEVWNLYQYFLPERLQQDFLIGATLCSTPTKKYCRCTGHSLINEIDFSKLEKLED